MSQERLIDVRPGGIFHSSLTNRATVCLSIYPAVYLAMYRLSSLAGHAVQLIPTVGALAWPC